MNFHNAFRKYVVPAFGRVLFRARTPADMVRLGSEYGGWWVPRDVLESGKIAYCAGVGEDVTFDRELAERGLEVWSFDPTPRSVDYMRKHGDGINFEPLGWWDSVATQRFYAPANPLHVSHSIDNLQGTTDYFDAAVTTVGAIAARLGHETVDIMKMDIEGAERRVVASLLDHGPLPRILCIEFDYPYSVKDFLGIIRTILKSGYRILKIEQRNYTFELSD